MNQPAISVIMSVYNGEKYLRDAVDSILNQTFRDFEFIVIDDCSSDASYQMLKEYAGKDSRIQLIRKDKNIGIKGFIENLNIGLNSAKGKYIARMDADDISDPKRFEKQHQFLEGNPQTFIVGSFLEIINENGGTTGEFKAPEDDRSIKKKMPNIISLYHPVIMFRNGPQIFYRDKMLYCEDYDLYLRLMTSGFGMANIPEKLLKYRIHSSSISRKDSNFIKNLFIYKMFQFYKERKRKGTDSYHLFSPDTLLNIKEQQSAKKDIIFAMKVALATDNKPELNALITLEKDHNKELVLFKTISKFPAPLFRLFGKIANKTR